VGVLGGGLWGGEMFLHPPIGKSEIPSEKNGRFPVVEFCKSGKGRVVTVKKKGQRGGGKNSGHTFTETTGPGEPQSPWSRAVRGIGREGKE